MSIQKMRHKNKITFPYFDSENRSIYGNVRNAQTDWGYRLESHGRLGEIRWETIISRLFPIYDLSLLIGKISLGVERERKQLLLKEDTEEIDYTSGLQIAG